MVGTHVLIASSDEVWCESQLVSLPILLRNLRRHSVPTEAALGLKMGQLLISELNIIDPS